ncbi:hypothetical protein DF048_27645 [Burkholderia seminalis]|nr:hypothetical protein [Burkholderia thailandensis]RQS88096.1 hypothetical protein DF048_27645 [Burkholderia seminalis]
MQLIDFFLHPIERRFETAEGQLEPSFSQAAPHLLKCVALFQKSRDLRLDLAKLRSRAPRLLSSLEITQPFQ